MGHKKKMSKVDVQKAKLKSLFNMMLATTKEILLFQLTISNDLENTKGIKKLIKECEKAQEIVMSITHLEILISLYNTFINGKETYFLTLSKLINNKNTIKKWDRTEKGFKLFQELENQAKAKTQEEYTKQLEQQEMIKKAKEQGKKVEMVYIDGKLQPRVVEEKSN